MNINEIIESLNSCSFELSTDGYDIGEVDGWIKDLTNRLQSAGMFRLPMQIPYPDFAARDEKPRFFLFGKKGYDKGEVREWLDSLSKFSDTFILDKKNIYSDNNF